MKLSPSGPHTSKPVVNGLFFSHVCEENVNPSSAEVELIHKLFGADGCRTAWVQKGVRLNDFVALFGLHLHWNNGKNTVCFPDRY